MKDSVCVCLVSAQAVPNLTPALDRGLRPREVVLLVSPDMQRQADWLEEVLRPRGIRLSRWPLADPWDIERIKDRVLELLVVREDEDLLLNATGGTKPMSIAAYEVFRQFERPICCVHPEKDRLVWMHPAGRPSVDLEDRLRLEHFLQAYGAAVERMGDRIGVEAALRGLAADLVQGVDRYGGALASLNWLAQQAEGSLRSPALSRAQSSDRTLMDLIERFQSVGLLALRGGRLRFPDERLRFVVNGGWFEAYVYARLYGLRAEVSAIQDLQRSVRIGRRVRHGKVRNELDVAFLADNRFYLIECKTRKWSRQPDQADAAGTEAIYKLDTLKDLLGGLQGRAMLVSYWRLPNADLRRAADLGIRVCHGVEIRRLDSELERWING